MSKHKHILYFSTNEVEARNFKQYCMRNNAELKFAFQLVEPSREFRSVFDLKLFLENNKAILTSLYVIIDFVSLSMVKNPDPKQDEPKFRVKTPSEMRVDAEMLRAILMSYPEVGFAFDETFKISYSGYLFCADKIAELQSCIHSFDRNDNKALDKLLNGHNNLFDASNLRYICKKRKYGSLHVIANFHKIQYGRSRALAYVVEEERAQNLFNSYVLFANGFRVLPISSAWELKFVNSQASSQCEPSIKPSIILRDYDLQFADEADMATGVVNVGVNINVNEVDKIRGFKRVNKKWVSLLSDANDYWSKFTENKTPIYFVTKSDENSGVKVAMPNGTEISDFSPCDGNETLSVFGLPKPINGIYVSLHALNEVREQYKETLYNDPNEVLTDKDGNPETMKNPETGEDEPIKIFDIRTARIDNNHSTPLDIYEMVRSMVKRAEQYYADGKYLYAALVSSEAIEVVNGFHLTLMLKAYYINAISENALAVKLLGANEERLREDTWFRLAEKVPQDLRRLCPKAPELQKNMLVSIYNESRRFCKEKEHFDSAEVALSLLVHVNHGLFGRGKSKVRKDKKQKSDRMNKSLKEFGRFVVGFPVSFVVLGAMILLSLSCSPANSIFFWSLIIIFGLAVVMLLVKPMQIVYGLVGTKGDVKKFIGMFALVVLCFSFTYYNSFFKDAGVTYDMDVPQVEYRIFSETRSLDESEEVKSKNALLHDLTNGKYVDCCNETFVHSPDKTPYRYYKRITFPFILRQTFLTSLTTSPTDFFNSVSVDYKNNVRSIKYNRLFNLILLYQILISWIFLGVFISLIYQKFRNE